MIDLIGLSRLNEVGIIKNTSRYSDMLDSPLPVRVVIYVIVYNI